MATDINAQKKEIENIKNALETLYASRMISFNQIASRVNLIPPEKLSQYSEADKKIITDEQTKLNSVKKFLDSFPIISPSHSPQTREVSR